MVKVCLAHERAITPISDPIHGRFEINLFEREFIDSPYFQRLHFILQNSVSYTTFPANKNTRFPHSLGVAHVCGQLFSNGLKKATHSSLHSFLVEAAGFIENVYLKIYPRAGGASRRDYPTHFRGIKNAHLHTISGQSGFFHSPIFPDKNENGDVQRVHTERKFGQRGDFETIFIIDTLWQAVRLYGLMHDVGHLPMSHAFEMALKSQKYLMHSYGVEEETREHFNGLFDERKMEFTSSLDEEDDEDPRSAYAEFFADLLDCDKYSIEKVAFDKEFHEIRGLSLYNRFILTYQSTFGGDDGDIKKYADLIHHLTLCIFFSSALSYDQLNSGNKGFLLAIKSLVDGELDGDRMDYTLRDGHEAGSDIGKFDLTRIVSNAMLVCKGSAKTRYSFGYYIRALSGIEQFFEQRFQSYKYIIYHRTASRANTCLERLIGQIIQYSFISPNSDIAIALEDFGYIERSNDKITSLLPDKDEDLFRIDDANLRTLFLKIYKIIDGKSEKNMCSDNVSHLDIIEQDIWNLIRIVVFRDYAHVVDPLKKTYPLDFLLEQHSDITEDKKILSEYLVKLITEKKEHTHNLQCLLNERSWKGEIPYCSVLVSLRKPKLFDSLKNEENCFERQVLIVDEAGKTKPIEDVSAMLASMGERRHPETYARFYLASRDIKFDKVKYLRILSVVNEYLRNELLKFIKLHKER